jgi:serine/threonine protein kinase
LIIHDKQLFALKIIPKESIDKTKRIEHVKNEKRVLYDLRKGAPTQEETNKIELKRKQLLEQKKEKEKDKDAEKTEFRLPEVWDDKTPINFMVRLQETFVDEENVNFVFEYLPGQDLVWILSNEHNLFLSKTSKRKDWVQFYCAEILCGLEALHQNGIIYRDMKPDNVMIDKEGHIKIIDFGFSKILSQKNNWRTTTNCGTVGYTAPEIISSASTGYSFSIDLWAWAILLCELLTGSLPFEDAADPMAIQEQILKAKIRITRPQIDFDTRDLLQKIFVLEPNLRINLDGIKKHRHFTVNKPADYWKLIVDKTAQEAPYKPNPLKYQYLLQNKYKLISNLGRKVE